MNGRADIHAAFSPDGARHCPVVICYEDIFIRDHWDELARCPWWYLFDPGMDRQWLWRSAVIEALGQDWFMLPLHWSEEDAGRYVIDRREGGVFRIDRTSGREEPLNRPLVGGWQSDGAAASVAPDRLADTPDAIDRCIPLPPAAPSPPPRQAANGNALAERLLSAYGPTRAPLTHIASPLWQCYGLWGFEGMMTMIARRPDLVRYACGRYARQTGARIDAASAAGAELVWVEECMTDMIAPEDFRSLNLPWIRTLTERIRAAGMKSIYYFCGNPSRKLEMIIESGADALAFEESKKGFTIDIAQLAQAVRGRCVLLGNLDTSLLEKATAETLRAEIRRQKRAGITNKHRFIMSTGSPITPGTSVERVRRYGDLVREQETPPWR